MSNTIMQLQIVKIVVLLLCFLQPLFALTKKINSFHAQRSFLTRINSSLKPKLEIEYCTGCKWLLRSAYYAQELLVTFESDLNSVSLKPNMEKPGGVFRVTVDEQVIWDRRQETTPGLSLPFLI